MKALQNRLDLILERIESPKFLKNDGLGNEIDFGYLTIQPSMNCLYESTLSTLTKNSTSVVTALSISIFLKS